MKTTINYFEIKRWFLDKNWNDRKYQMFQLARDAEIIGESEKAYQVAVEDCDIDYTHKIWIPKSCIMTAEEAEAAYQAEIAKAAAIENRYMNLVNFAKEAGLKGIRVGLKAKTIREKLAAAGIQYVA